MRKQWYRLDNAALIFPAIIRKNWNNVFRVSVTLREKVDPLMLDRAVAALMPRFPTCFVKLKAGFFWYHLEAVDHPPRAQEDYAYPLTHMTRKELKTCCVRFRYHENRIAAEFFHSVTDGSGGMRLLENLAALYLEMTGKPPIPRGGKLVDPREPSLPEERRDCFPLCAAKKTVSRGEETAWRLRGTPEKDRFRHIITGIVPTEALLARAHEQGVTVTAYLAAALAEAVGEIQEARRIPLRRRLPLKITVPVNLRRTFGLDTMRNFTLAVNIGVDPRLGAWRFEEICRQMGHLLAAETVPQRMAGRVAKNVDLQRNLLIRLIPLPVKTLCMRTVYRLSGESKGCLNLSNMGEIRLPREMAAQIERFEFIIGVQYTYPNNCSVVSFDGRTYISMIRGIRESELERRFFSHLVERGIPVDIESNSRPEKPDRKKERRK